MRNVAMLLLLTGCAANVPAPESSKMSFRVVASGQNARRDEARTSSMAIFDQRTLESLWPSISSAAAPAVDFDKESLIVLFAGSRPTGGWSIEPRAVTPRADGWIVVDAPVRRPPPDAIVTQALTSPWIAIAVPKRDVKGISWHPQ